VFAWRGYNQPQCMPAAGIIIARLNWPSVSCCVHRSHMALWVWSHHSQRLNSIWQAVLSRRVPSLHQISHMPESHTPMGHLQQYLMETHPCELYFLWTPHAQLLTDIPLQYYLSSYCQLMSLCFSRIVIFTVCIEILCGIITITVVVLVCDFSFSFSYSFCWTLQVYLVLVIVYS